MTQIDPNFAQDPVVFSAVIEPHRSLSPKGLAIVMGGLGLAAFFTSIPFFLLGAWPVLGFMGLDVVLIYAAFRYHNATARAYEQVFLSRFALLVRSVSWRGTIREWHFNPVWTRLERDVHPEFGLEKLALVQGRQQVEIAASLGREERAAFADAFQSALSETKKSF